jgi:hypothetical protein
VVDPLPSRLEKAGDTGRPVGGLDQLDPGFAHAQERDSDAVGLDVADVLDLEPEDVPVERERGLDRSDDDGDMVNPARRVDGAAPLRP